MSDPAPVTVRTRGLVLTEHEVSVPLDHARPDGEQVTVFAREVADPDGLDKPFLVFLQGGPGNEAPRPTRYPTNPPWLDRALRDYRVLMLDQRGTGRSQPVGVLPGLTPAQQAERLTHYRADAIVADCELVRQHIGVDRWSVLGQSFGGFCTLRYLSAAPDALREAFFTGGVPPVGVPVDDVYRATYATMLGRNTAYYDRYPGDRDRVRRLHEAADAGELRLPGGEPVTSRRLRSIGNGLGMSDGAEKLHYLLELDPRSPMFLHDLAGAFPFDGRNPLYAVVHEACYADGGPTRWSAERVLPDRFAEDVTLFTGEHIFPWTFHDDPALTPLGEAAQVLAEHDWPRLYDEAALAACDVPAAAAVYTHDAYVDRAYSEQTVALVPGLRAWVSDQHEHNALRADGEAVLDRLIALAHGRDG